MKTVVWCCMLFVVSVSSARLRKLERIVISNQECLNDSGCKENSFCYGRDNNKIGVCKCIQDYFLINPSNYMCVRDAKLGEKCVKDEQCELNLGLDSQCNEDFICECLSSAHYVEEQEACYNTSRLDGICVDHYNCLSKDNEQVYCSYGKCTCGLNEHIVDGRCVKSARLGANCLEDDSCIHLNAVCRGVCKCKIDYVIADNQEICLKAAVELGVPDSCKQLSQCTHILENSFCYENKCVCEASFHVFGNRCFRSRYLGEPCNNYRECIVEPKLEDVVECTNGVCSCKSGTDPNKGCAKLNSAQYNTLHFFGLIIIIAVFLIN